MIPATLPDENPKIISPNNKPISIPIPTPIAIPFEIYSYSFQKALIFSMFLYPRIFIYYR